MLSIELLRTRGSISVETLTMHVKVGSLTAFLHLLAIYLTLPRQLFFFPQHIIHHQFSPWPKERPRDARQAQTKIPQIKTHQKTLTHLSRFPERVLRNIRRLRR
jgi:hypothetical protein